MLEPRTLARCRSGLWLALAFAFALALEAWAAADSTPVQFNRDIRPLLAENCFACHGPDPNTRKAKLRLDTRDGLFTPVKDRTPVVPGDPASSEVHRRVTTEDADDRMPPPESGKKLSNAQVDLLKRWIEGGAKWQGHWAYEPLRPPALPRVKDERWPANPIDRFILARLEREGLDPSPEAYRRTLIRRVSFDLTGLPPASGEVQAFCSEVDPDAYARLVDRLLASPHYGERMAIHWLDIVRYADTDGFHADNYRSVWPYRDYVIRAFNENHPFDQFTIEQLAGDLLPGASLAQRLASTFNRLGRSTEEGGAQPKEYLAKYAAERVRAVGTAWLGATTGCAECHDHKYDPYTTRDFYRLAAYFADVKEEGVGKREESVVPGDDEQAAALGFFDGAILTLETALRTLTPELEETKARWEADLNAQRSAGTLHWAAVKPTQVETKNGTTLTIQDDLSVLASGKDPDRETYTVTLPADRPRITAVRLEALMDPSMAKAGLSRATGNFVLTDLKVEAQRGKRTEPVAVAEAAADFSQDGWPVAAAIDHKPESGWAVAGHEKPANRTAVFTFAKPFEGGPGTALRISLKHESENKQHVIGRFRLSLISLDRPTIDPEGLPEKVVAALRERTRERTEDQAKLLDAHFLKTTPALDPEREMLAAKRDERAAFVKDIPTALLTVAGEARETRVLPRGNWLDESGDVVQPAPPAFLCSTEAADPGATRLDLARWIVSKDNPLTARVFVNRLWKLFFGTGISKNLDDLGTQGEWPQHPELLDWLASEFVASGWDVKHLVRLIVTSRAYRQSSFADAALTARDPFNRLVARQSRFLLDAEMVRDNGLAVSGLLVPKVGGPSVKPYQPEGYWDLLNFPKRKWQADEGDSLYRRGLYTLWCRTFLHPSLMAFDACPREESTAQRTASNTPLQALTLLNDPTYVEAARALAERILRQGGAGTEDRLAWTFTEALARKPAAEERGLLRELVESETARFRTDTEAARRLLAVGAKPAADDLDRAELAAWTSVARVVLNLHEMITRY